MTLLAIRPLAASCFTPGLASIKPGSRVLPNRALPFDSRQAFGALTPTHIETHDFLGVKMVLRLRLSRVSTPGGAKRHQPFYNIVLAQARSARDSKPMEVLGTYDPIPQMPVGGQPGDRKAKDIKLDVSRTKYWLGVGAQPSDTVWRLLSMIGLLEPKYLPHGPQSIKAVRFPSRESTSGKTQTVKGKPRTNSQATAVMDAIEREILTPQSEFPASNTSPQNPNKA